MTKQDETRVSEVPPGQTQVPDVCLVTCGIVREEVRAILRRNSLSLPIYSLAPAPCLDQRAFQSHLAKTLKRLEGRCKRIIVVIGRCHPEVDELISETPGATRVPMDNCFAALLGQDYLRLRGERPTFFTTPAWLKNWRKAMKRAGWDGADTRQNLGFNERILVLDTGVISYTPEEALEFFDFAQVPLEFLLVNLDRLERLLLAALSIPNTPDEEQSSPT